MGKQIDVLAVIDIYIDPTRVPRDHPAQKHDLVEARAVIARLIEAGRCLLDGEPGDDEWEQFEYALRATGAAS